LREVPRVDLDVADIAPGEVKRVFPRSNLQSVAAFDEYLGDL
jgi:hypothetical protein